LGKLLAIYIKGEQIMAKLNTTKIIRSRNSAKYNFTPLSNTLLQNPKVSLEVKGLISFILSLPEDWIIYKGQVQRALEMGDTKFDRIWKEAVSAGFIVVTKERDKGKFIYHYEISDCELTAGGKSTYGKPTTIQKTQGEKIDQQKNIIKTRSNNQVSTSKSFVEIFNNNISSENALKYINNEL
jgi:hypothetical protein